MDLRSRNPSGGRDTEPDDRKSVASLDRRRPLVSHETFISGRKLLFVTDHCAAGLALVNVKAQHEVESRLRKYVELLARWRMITSLMSGKGFSQVWTRHLADCAQLLGFAPLARRWVDLGSGAGFPGIIIAILLAEAQGVEIHCIESDHRKCAFLREVARATAAPVRVHTARIEMVDLSAISPIDAVTSRALAPLPRLVEYAGVWLASGAIGIFPRGRSEATRIHSLSISSEFQLESFQSKLDIEARIVRIRSRAPAEK